MLVPRPAEPYASRAIKATALLDETRVLLRAWSPGQTAADLLAEAVEADLLGKATAARVEDVVRAFARRYLADGDEPAASLRQLLSARGSGAWFEQVCLVASARADVVVRETVTVFLADLLQRGAAQVDVPALMRFLEAQEAAGRTRTPWSVAVRRSVAQHVLHLLTDFGVLGPPRARGGAREVLAFRPRDRAVGWLASDLHRRGESDAGLVAHEDWRVFQFTESEARAALDRLSDHGLWIYQGAGEVVRVTWVARTWLEAVRALAGEAFDG